MSQRRCSHREAWHITSAAHPDAATLMSAFGRSRNTVQFFNSREAKKSTPEKANAKKEFWQFVNEKTKSGVHPVAAYNDVGREHPDLIAAMQDNAGFDFVNSNSKRDPVQHLRKIAQGHRGQFTNVTGDGATPVGSPQFNRLFYLLATATQEQFSCAWIANGSTASPINPAKIFAGLVELAQKQSSLDYDAAIARCKSDFPDLWEACELLSKEPV